MNGSPLHLRTRRQPGARAFVGATVLALAALASPSPALAADIWLSYEFSTSLSSITNIMLFNTYSDFGQGETWPFDLPSGSGVITDPFPKATDNPPLTGLILGLSDDGSALHLVMAADVTAGAAAVGQPFANLFPNSTEQDVVSSLQYVTSTDSSVDPPTWNADFDVIYNFATGDAAGYRFDLGAAIAGQTTTTDFAVLAFSNATAAGTGWANVTTVPEPASLVLIGSLAGLGLAVRRRG